MWVVVHRGSEPFHPGRPKGVEELGEEDGGGSSGEGGGWGALGAEEEGQDLFWEASRVPS